MLSGAADEGEKLGGTPLVYFEWAIIGQLEGSLHCISTYKNVSTLGQVHADMGLVLGMALWMGVPDLLWGPLWRGCPSK